MVAAFCFLALLEPSVQLLLSEEGCAVDALHLRAFRIAFPISSGEAEEFERPQLVRVGHVRPKTEIYERRAVNVIDAHARASLLVNQFALQRLVALLENLQSLTLRNLVAAICKVALCNIAHTLFDYRQIIFRQGARRDDIVEKSVSRVFQESRTDAKLCSGKQIEHGCCEKMRRRMPEHVQAFERLRQDGFNPDRLAVLLTLKSERQINLTPVDTGCQCLLRC